MRNILQPQTLIILGAVIIIGYLALVPLGYLLWTTFFKDGVFTLEFFREAYSARSIGELASNSMVFAIGSTILAVTIGTALAYLNVRTDVPFKGLIFVMSLVPLIIPGILHTIAWVFLLSPRIGVLNNFLPFTFNINSMAGAVWVEGLHLSPLVFLLMVAAFKSMDPSLEESAIMSGARLPLVFRKITMPLAAPALAASVLVMMVRALESFEVPSILLLPVGVYVFTSRIWSVLDRFPPGFGQAGAYALSLLALTSVGVYLNNRFSKRARRFSTVTGKGFRPHPMELGKWRWPAAIGIFAYFFIAVLMPLLILLYSSTQNFYQVPSWEALSNMTLDNYRYTLTNPESLLVLKNSFILGIGSATAVMILTAVAAWLVVRTKLPGRWMVDNLAFVPLVIPGLVMGVALLFVYLRHPLPIYGTLWILFIAYMTRYMPYGMRYSSSSMIQISGELEESAQTSGASWFQTFRRINLPLLMPGLLAGWIYIVTVSVRELSSSILLYSPGNQVLSIRIWEQYQNGQFNELASLGIVMVLGLVVLILIARSLGARIGVREH